MNHIYARVSTEGQTTDSQLSGIVARYPGANVVSETMSGVKNRPKLLILLNEMKSGDTLVVAALDRLGRKTSEVLQLIEDLQKRNINIVSIREGIDYSTAVGRLVTQILVSVAEMERAMISERTKNGLRNAVAKGKRLGRTPHANDEQMNRGEALINSGWTCNAAAKEMGIRRETLRQFVKSKLPRTHI